MQKLLRDSYGIGPADPWACQGFSARLVELATGRAAIVADIDDGETAEGGAPVAQWKAARAMLARARRPTLVDLTAEPRAELTRDEALLAYALACYLIEAHGARVANLLDELGRGRESGRSVLERALAMDLAALDIQLAGWAAERGE